MAEQTTQSMKKLTRIKLINWHYFSNETIDVCDSVLFTGENGTGKSTILDAIQLALTTNSRRFNPAANEKSKRDLKGYVRCKTGEEGNTYVRGNGPVISYVALEFFEEGKSRYFVIGVKIDSPTLEGELDKKWFCVEGNLDSISFIVKEKPAIDKEFTQNGRKIQLEKQTGRAKENFKDRLGHLGETFFEMIPKAIAFKPMENVKKFINQYILPEATIDVQKLQESIRALRDMQNLVDQVKNRIDQLTRILEKSDQINKDNEKILVIDLLIKIAELKSNEAEIERLKNQCSMDILALESYQRETEKAETEKSNLNEKIQEINLALKTNENARLVEQLEREVKIISDNLKEAEKKRKELTEQVKFLNAIRSHMPKKVLADFEEFLNPEQDETANQSIFVELKNQIFEIQGNLYQKQAELNQYQHQQEEKRNELSVRISQLEKHKFLYDSNTTGLRDAINAEFAARKTDAKAYVFSELLEISNPEWQNAVEGYLNTQRFHLIVEPQYYDIAADVYHRNRHRFHSVGLVNAAKLDPNVVPASNSLAAVVTSENRYAHAYATYLLGRVMRVGTVEQLKQHEIAITQDCMLYQGHALRKIPETVCQTPYIGKHAIRRQLEIAREHLVDLDKEIGKRVEDQKTVEFRIDLLQKCNLTIIGQTLTAPGEYQTFHTELYQKKGELEEAKQDSDLVSMMEKQNSYKNQLDDLTRRISQVNKNIFQRERNIQDAKNKIQDLNSSVEANQRNIQNLANGNVNAIQKAYQMFDENTRTKDAGTVYANYQPRRQTLVNQKTAKERDLWTMQNHYENGELGTGIELIPDYLEEYDKLVRSELVKYENQIRRNRESCEEEFRENFLAKMRENIERADEIFKQLNRSLKDVYYGNDSYKFELTPNKNKQSLYKMITSDVNVGGITLFSQIFEDEYREEMEDLFQKLTESSIDGESVLAEYADYRSYLDFDIQVISRDGRMQKFSKTYGEKSGGETQTPYYVAIAASFAQMYSGGETARLIIFDEAFNNMDEDRIESMMKFLKHQNFQMILAAPPVRAEIISQYVRTFDTVFHTGNCSWVEPYVLPEN